jgi:excisionase family DNA binding protein
MNQHRPERMTVHDAARRLGISEDAVRMRVKRGTLEAEREGGRLYVVLDTEPTPEPTDRTDLLIAELQDRVRSLEEANRENRRIIAALTQRIPEIEPPRSPVEHLEDEEALREEAEMEARDTETRSSGHFQRYGAPRRETPSDPSEAGAPQMAEDEQQGRGPITHDEGPQESTERPWWRRLFG